MQDLLAGSVPLETPDAWDPFEAFLAGEPVMCDLYAYHFTGEEWWSAAQGGVWLGPFLRNDTALLRDKWLEWWMRMGYSNQSWVPAKHPVAGQSPEPV